jgi:hypothetical protein
MKFRFALAASALLVSGTAHAALTGTPVSGTLMFGGGAVNYFDPTNGFVPPGFGNTSGTSVVVGSGTEFGYADQSNTDTADFTDTQLIVTDLLARGLSTSWTMTFTSAAFGSITLNTSSFSPDLTYSLLGNTVTIHWAGTTAVPQGTSYRAIFDIGSAAAVPEPATWALMLLGFGAIGVAVRRKGRLATA